MDIKTGQIVLSRAGRDKGKKMLVVSVIDKDYIMIADGDTRKIEKPKKKKIKHVIVLEKKDKDIMEKLLENKKISNSDIRKVLKEDGEKIV